MRWDPQVIRWCLHLWLVSAGRYHLLHDSGVIRLPSERTHSDYTHYILSQTGLQDGVPEQLAREAKLEEICKKYVCLTYDEMKIKERLVYNKFTDQLVGFECQCQPDGPIKKPEHMLVLLIRGLFTKVSTSSVCNHRCSISSTIPNCVRSSYAARDYGI